MPSLQALEEFRSSFSRIGDEQDAPVELPDSGSATGPDLSQLVDLPQEFLDSFPQESGDPLPGDLGLAGDGPESDIFDNFGDLLGGASDSEEYAPAGQEDIEFGEFIDTIPDDFASPSPAVEENAFSDEFSLEGFEGLEGFGSPPEEGEESPAQGFDTAALLDGLADEIEAGRAFPGGESLDFGMEETTEDNAGDSAAEFAAVDTGFGEFDSLPGFDSGESMEFSAEDIPAFADEAFAEGAFAGEETSAGEAFGEEAFAGGTFAEEPFAEEPFAMELPDDDEGFEIGAELPAFDSDAVLEELPGDAFDSFKLDASALTGDFDLPKEDSASLGGALDDFSLAGVDDIFQGASDPVNVATQKAGLLAAGTAARKAAAQAETVEEIRLSNEELEQFQATLSSYPLNLRIACQELIAERAVDPAKMSRLVKMLIAGASAREAASFAGKILDRPIPIPKGFEKKTGEALEAEQSSFGYIFVHNFLPIFRLFIVVALVGLCLGYLGWRFVYNPIRADRIYQYGLEQIHTGQFARANERFLEAFRIHPRASWFYEYARAFVDARQFTLAEEKYLQLLNFTASRSRRGIPDRAAVLEYAYMVGAILGHHERAEGILRRNLLDFFPADRDGLLALGDNAMAWGEYDPSRFEDAREAFARIIERDGRSDVMLERMLMFFIRTDDLEQVLALQSHFMASARRRISAVTLAEMGGYFLDKRTEEVRGVPNQFLEHIGGIREVLLRAIRQDPMLPEAYYHLARYYEYFRSPHDERLTLEVGLRVFQAAGEGSPRRIRSHINALRRYGELLIGSREFFPAREHLVRGIALYQDGISRRLLTPAPEFGRLYALMGDLELFAFPREGNMQAALEYYRLAEQNLWAPPEIQFRMGVAYYHLAEWGQALERFLAAHREMPLNRRILYALGNASFLRGNYFAAQGFYDQLLAMLYADRDRLPSIMPTGDDRQRDLVRRIMVAQNNLGVTLEALTERTGDNSFRARAQGLHSASAHAWDIYTRDPETMIRRLPSRDINAPGASPGFANIMNILDPGAGYGSFFFMRIDTDMFEFSDWEILAPPEFRLSEGVGE
ncbi:MAG: tetratricopeptide repeat protein [Treponema sp.]|nr:tetratricopeptide repeat protein [Treponema sp.]